MKIFTIIATVLAIGIIGFNATKLDFNHLFAGDSMIALISIFASLCVVVLLQVFRLSKKIERQVKS